MMPVRILATWSRYKAFNTFIDDAFAWMIEMPTKHRVMTLRDDLVFFIYLFQRHLYAVDKTRPNEFGRVYEEAAAEQPQRAGQPEQLAPRVSSVEDNEEEQSAPSDDTAPELRNDGVSAAAEEEEVIGLRKRK
jgi:hypothetical protein